MKDCFEELIEVLGKIKYNNLDQGMCALLRALILAIAAKKSRRVEPNDIADKYDDELADAIMRYNEYYRYNDKKLYHLHPELIAAILNVAYKRE